MKLTLSTKDLIELRQISENAEFIGNLVVVHVLWIEERWNIQILFGHTESKLIVVINVLLLQLIKVSENEKKEKLEDDV